jgi:hypothetical protein
MSLINKPDQLSSQKLDTWFERSRIRITPRQTLYLNDTFNFLDGYFRMPTTACAVAYHYARIRRLVRLAGHR